MEETIKEEETISGPIMASGEKSCKITFFGKSQASGR